MIGHTLGGGRVALSVVLGLALSWEAHALFSPAAHVRAAGRRPYVVADFGAGVPVGQTFRMPSDGLDAIDVRFFSDQETLLSLRCRLLGPGDSLPGHWSLVQDWTAMIRLPRGSSWHRFAFAPVVPSSNQVYQFQLERVDARGVIPSGQRERPSVAVMGSIDDSLPDGNLVVGPTQVTNRDLFFEANAADSVFEDFRRHAQTQLPTPLRSVMAQLTLLAAYNGAVAVFAFHMLFRAREDHDE